MVPRTFSVRSRNRAMLDERSRSTSGVLSRGKRMVIPKPLIKSASMISAAMRNGIIAMFFLYRSMVSETAIALMNNAINVLFLRLEYDDILITDRDIVFAGIRSGYNFD